MENISRNTRTIELVFRALDGVGASALADAKSVTSLDKFAGEY